MTLWPTVRRLLQPEKPLTPIDATFQATLNGSGARSLPAAAVWVG
jgi:hypothetical protein